MTGNQTELTQKDFIFTEDFPLMYECEKCGYTEDCEEELFSCPECKSDRLIPTTAHENTECDLCGISFDMWHDNFANKDTGNQTVRNICEDCFDNLKTE